MTAPTEPTAVAVADRKPSYLAMLEKHIPTFADFLPEGVKPERVIAAVRTSVAGNPKIAECTPISIVQAVARAMQLDLEIGVNAYLIPRKQWNPATREKEMTCTMLPDYRAHIEMIVKSGAARSVEADVVREGDFFEYELGLEPKLRHVPAHVAGARITHVYGIVRLRFGYSQFVVLTREEVEAVRAKSQGWSDDALAKKGEATGLEAVPWYAKKTAVIRATNLVPKNPRLAKWLGEVERAYDPNDLSALAKLDETVPPVRPQLRAPEGLTGYGATADGGRVDPTTGEDLSDA